MLFYLRHDLCNIILKIKNKLHIAAGSASPLQRKILGAQLGLGVERIGGSKESGDSEYGVSKLHTM